jgi:hypothetical protein
MKKVKALAVRYKKSEKRDRARAQLARKVLRDVPAAASSGGGPQRWINEEEFVDQSPAAMAMLRIPQYIMHQAPRSRRRKYPPPEGELSESDRRELARLVGKYGRDIICARANDVPLRGPGRPPKGRKYPHPKGGLSEPDRKELARLVGKYGRDIICARANDVPLRGPGRPLEGTGPLRRTVDLAICFEDLVDQHRQAGSRKPIADAERELFEFECSKEEQRQPGRFERWQKNIRKKRSQGKRELKRRRAAARAGASSFQKPTKGRK